MSPQPPEQISKDSPEQAARAESYKKNFAAYEALPQAERKTHRDEMVLIVEGEVKLFGPDYETLKKYAEKNFPKQNAFIDDVPLPVKTGNG